MGISSVVMLLGLKRQRPKARRGALSRTSCPVLFCIHADVTEPVAGSTFTTATPFPVRLERARPVDILEETNTLHSATTNCGPYFAPIRETPAS
jgi:hypothetical protein